VDVVPTPASIAGGAEADDVHAVADDGVRPVGLLRRLFYVLSPAEKRQLWMLLPAVIVMALLDAAGLASIVPFLGLLADPDAIENSAVLGWAYSAGGFTSSKGFFFAVGLAVLGILTFGNLFSAATTYALLRFSWMRNHSLSMRLLRGYLRRPYGYFLTQNTSQLAQRILAEVQQVVAGIVVASMQLSARLVVVAFVLVALVLLDPMMAVGVGAAFGVVYGALFMIVRRRLTLLGKRRIDANRERFRLAAEMLTGIKEVKLAGLEEVFLSRYAQPSFAFANTVAEKQVIAQLPRFALETIAFGGVIVIVLYLLRSGQGLTDVLPVLGVYAFAAYRMLPSLQQIFAGLSGLRAAAASLDALVEDLPPATDEDELPRAEVAPLPFEEELRLENVSFRYENADTDALAEIDLSLRPGEWVALVGPTGSGKSTLVDVLLGLLVPERGRLIVDGTPVSEAMLAAWSANAGYVPQQIFLADDTVAHNIAFGDEADEVDRERLEHAAKVAQIHDFITEELPGGYDAMIGERGVRISGGQRQRLGIARAVYRRPRFLVLDEATSALDNETEARFFDALHGALRDVSVISIAHRLSTTRTFDRIHVIERGRIVDSGTYDELATRSALFASVREEMGAGTPAAVTS
jgi:ABC-type multidrug transport system fused ATPase/permease subunit